MKHDEQLDQAREAVVAAARAGYLHGFSRVQIARIGDALGTLDALQSSQPAAPVAEIGLTVRQEKRVEELIAMQSAEDQTFLREFERRVAALEARWSEQQRSLEREWNKVCADRGVPPAPAPSDEEGEIEAAWNLYVGLDGRLSRDSFHVTARSLIAGARRKALTDAVRLTVRRHGRGLSEWAQGVSDYRMEIEELLSRSAAEKEATP